MLKIGITVWPHLRHYPASAREIAGLDPTPRLIAMTRRIVERPPSPFEFIKESAEAIPLDHPSLASIDTVSPSMAFASDYGTRLPSSP